MPDSWLRGFLQVQSAATLPRDSFSTGADRSLQRAAASPAARRPQGQTPRHAGRAGARRAAAAGAGALGDGHPRLGRHVHGPAAEGGARLGTPASVAAPAVAPFVETVEVHLLGSGLPSFWVLRAGGMTADARPDRLHRRQLVAGAQLRPAVAAQDARRRSSWRRPRPPGRPLEGRRRRAGQGDRRLKWEALIEALQLGCQQGRHHVRPGRRRLPPPAADRRPARPREARIPQRARADRPRPGRRRAAVAIVGENRIPAVGLELTGRTWSKRTAASTGRSSC